MIAPTPAKLDTLEFDAIIDREVALSSDVPSYAVENGYEVSDNIVLKPIELTVTAVFSNTPITWRSQHGYSASRVETMCERIQQLWKDRKVVSFSAAGDTYDNMTITSCNLPHTTDHGSSVYVKFTLKEVTITQTQVVDISIAYARGGSSSANTGSGSSSTVSSSKSGSSKGSSSSSGAASSTSSPQKSKDSILVNLSKNNGLVK